MSEIDLTDLFSEFGNLVKEEALDGLKQTWDDLPGTHRQAVRTALVDMGDLMKRGLDGEDVSGEIAIVEAEIANWTFVGSGVISRAVKSTIVNVAKTAGAFLIGVAGRFVPGL